MNSDTSIAPIPARDAGSWFCHTDAADCGVTAHTNNTALAVIADEMVREASAVGLHFITADVLVELENLRSELQDAEFTDFCAAWDTIRASRLYQRMAR